MMTTYETNTDSIRIQQVRTSAYVIPTATPEADGTLSWEQTTLVLVQIEGGGKTGIGYTYSHAAAAYLIHRTLAKILVGKNALDIPAINTLLVQQIRNEGTAGIAMMAVSAIDNALWDLKAKLFDRPLYALLGRAKDAVLLYGSGGFTNYDDHQTRDQFSHWERQGIHYMKMKVGADPKADLRRIHEARKSLEAGTELFVDANGAYTARQALENAKAFSSLGITWLEEPVPSQNLEGLKLIRGQAPPPIRIAAGEYGYRLSDFHQLLSHEAIDILQADATRCGGISAFLKAGHLCEDRQVPFSSHCAPAIHLHAAISLPAFFIAEYFFDHVRIEQMLFDGHPTPINGCLYPDAGRPGLGIELKEADAEKYKI